MLTPSNSDHESNMGTRVNSSHRDNKTQVVGSRNPDLRLILQEIISGVIYRDTSRTRAMIGVRRPLRALIKNTQIDFLNMSRSKSH